MLRQQRVYVSGEDLHQGKDVRCQRACGSLLAVAAGWDDEIQ